MKLSVSISDRAYKMLQELVVLHRSNVSAIMEAGLLELAGVGADKRELAVRALHASKRATTRHGWMAGFWEALAVQFGTRDFDSTAGTRIFTLRNYEGFDLAFALDGEHDKDAPMTVMLMQSPPHSSDHFRVGTSFAFTRTVPVYDAARKVAAWINAHQTRELSSSSPL